MEGKPDLPPECTAKSTGKCKRRRRDKSESSRADGNSNEHSNRQRRNTTTITTASGCESVYTHNKNNTHWSSRRTRMVFPPLVTTVRRLLALSTAAPLINSRGHASEKQREHMGVGNKFRVLFKLMALALPTRSRPGRVAWVDKGGADA